MNFKAYNRVIEEGGAYGHMMNVWEDYTLQFEDLQRIIKQALTGGIKGEVKEKTDGQALAVSHRAGRVIFARNKGHYRDFGKNAIKGSKGILEFFKDHPNDNVKKAFGYAAKDLEKSILALSDRQKQLLFADGKRWVNVEVIWPATVNVIPYNHELLVLHNFREYDESGNTVGGDFNEYGRMMAGMIEQINQHVQDKYTITSMPLLKLPEVKNFEEQTGEYLGSINSLMSAHGLDTTNSVGDYWISYMSQYIQQSEREFGYIVQPDTLRKLAVRWAFKMLTPGKRPNDYNSTALSKITDLRQMVDNQQFLQWVGATAVKLVRRYCLLTWRQWALATLHRSLALYSVTLSLLRWTRTSSLCLMVSLLHWVRRVRRLLLQTCSRRRQLCVMLRLLALYTQLFTHTTRISCQRT